MATKVVRIFANYELPNSTLLLGRHERELAREGIRIYMNESGRADLTIVLNSAGSFRWTLTPSGSVIKILQEPIIFNALTHLFTYHHSRIYDEILIHTPDCTDSRQIESIPFVNSFVDPYLDIKKVISEKHLRLSVIASTLQILPGHKARHEFINELLIKFPDLRPHCFGKGREKQLFDKADGLKPYRFSIAIENTSTGSYITEKFTDCILAGCVPLYFGSPRVASYFPADCFIPLPINDLEEACRIVLELSDEDYLRRVPALLEAREVIRDRLSLGSLIMTRISSESPSAQRFVFLFRADSLMQKLFLILRRVRDSLNRFLRY